MADDRAPSSALLTHGLAVGLLASLLQQVLHESTHGVTALLVGKRWELLHLFASGSSWAGAADARADAVVAGSAALLDILVAAICIILFYRRFAVERPMLRLFLLYLGAFSLFSGFGYLMVDALFFDASDPGPGDWKRVIQVLGGGWGIRLPVLLIGAAGSLAGFFWLPYSTLRLTAPPLDRPTRVRLAFALLMAPYLATSALFTVLALWHPLGAEGTLLVALKYWFGDVGFFWGFFIAGYWANVRRPPPRPSPLPARPARGWLIASVAGWLIALALLLPGIHFQ